MHFFSLKLTISSSFTNDLGLGSLDAVEVVMAVEEVNHLLDYPYLFGVTVQSTGVCN